MPTPTQHVTNSVDVISAVVATVTIIGSLLVIRFWRAWRSIAAALREEELGQTRQGEE